jgi:REP element-mobilizing transposase RayT
MALLHLTAHLQTRSFDLTEDPVVARLWHGLRKAFPHALAADINPDHVHVITPGDDRDAARRRLVRAVSGATWGLGRGVWLPTGLPKVIPNAKHLQRQVRYVHLNPCRDGLVDDPARWLWSTHRDVIGATLDPWVTPARLRPALGWSPDGFRQRFHHYVSADPSVDVRGTPLPRALEIRRGSVPDLDTVVAAVAAATRLPPQSALSTPRTRRLALSLAVGTGWDDSRVLCEYFGVSRYTVSRTTGLLDGAAMESLLLVLGDDRLLAPAPRRTVVPTRRLLRIQSATPLLSPTTESL